MKGGRAVATLLVLFALAGAFFWFARAERHAVRPAVGFRTPPFSLPGLERASVTLPQPAGKPVLLNFWATWCEPCKAEMPEIQRFYSEHEDEVRVIGVDVYEPRAVVAEFVEAHGYRWEFALDEEGEVTERYRVRNIPTSFFIDGDGVIQAIYVGPMSLSRIEALYRKVASAP